MPWEVLESGGSAFSKTGNEVNLTMKQSFEILPQGQWDGLGVKELATEPSDLNAISIDGGRRQPTSSNVVSDPHTHIVTEICALHNMHTEQIFLRIEMLL